MTRLVLGLGLALVLAASPAAAQADTVAARARTLAVSGQRAEALALLHDHLERTPADDDARVLYGTVLSWDGRYADARAALEQVLASHPAHTDALAALLNVELWSNQPRRAKDVAERALAIAPNDGGFLAGRRRAIELIDLQRPWDVSVATSYDWFSDGRQSWQEQQAAVRRATPVGAIIVRGSRATRFGLTDQQVEIEMYPRFRNGTYAYVSAGYAPDKRLYPEYRFAFDVYQSLGAGFEASAGYRRLGFGSTSHVYVGTLNKYVGNWMATGQFLYVPGHGGTNSRTYQAGLRRYFGADGTSYAGARYSRGLARDITNVNDLEVLNSDTLGLELQAALGRRLRLSASGGTSRQQRLAQGTLDQHSASVSLGVRF